MHMHSLMQRNLEKFTFSKKGLVTRKKHKKTAMILVCIKFPFRMKFLDSFKKIMGKVQNLKSQNPLSLSNNFLLNQHPFILC